jgi:BMFP domain-containing protein YqiC
MSNCPLCEIDFSTDDIVVLQEHFVTAHSVDTGTAKMLVNLLQRIERLESRLGPDRDPILN